jgi:large subunit ribosomal protein L24e
MNCSFCKAEIKEGTGIVFAKKDGTIYNFCGSKCQKNMLKLGRKAANLKWTKN